jgi:hypothetical protein
MSEMTEEEFWSALAPLPIQDTPCFRLYYDDHGFPLFYSMQEEPGNYIEIDQETYINPPKHVQVIDGKLKVLTANPIAKLMPGEQGTSCAIDDVCIVVDESVPHIRWSLKT